MTDKIVIKAQDGCVICKALEDGLSEATKESRVEQSKLISSLLNGHLEACHSRDKGKVARD